MTKKDLVLAIHSKLGYELWYNYSWELFTRNEILQLYRDIVVNNKTLVLEDNTYILK